jgi:hypothetical protein
VSFEGGRAGAGLGESFAMAAGAYLDSAIPMSQFRLRYTAAYDDNRPDRAEYFYAKCGCFPDGRGPRLAETSVDFQDISGYLEIAANNRLSGFLEVPFRFLNPDQNANTAGFSDMNAGMKLALLADPCQYLTFQFRTYIPTGAASHGLGTGHPSVEPALLYWRQLTERLQVQAQVNDWIPISGTDFAGNVMEYGVGVSYEVYKSHGLRIAPVLEFVGWTVLNGKEFDATAGPMGTTMDASGDTIVNGKFGVRFWFGERSTFYAGYGRALTGDVWYKDIFRVEYGINF